MPLAALSSPLFVENRVLDTGLYTAVATDETTPEAPSPDTDRYTAVATDETTPEAPSSDTGRDIYEQEEQGGQDAEEEEEEQRSRATTQTFALEGPLE
jgi:hypothetical protein